MNYWHERIEEVKDKVYTQTKMRTHKDLCEILKDIENEYGIIKLKK
jgi:hypothetical protein